MRVRTQQRLRELCLAISALTLGVVGTLLWQLGPDVLARAALPQVEHDPVVEQFTSVGTGLWATSTRMGQETSRLVADHFAAAGVCTWLAGVTLTEQNPDRGRVEIHAREAVHRGGELGQGTAVFAGDVELAARGRGAAGDVLLTTPDGSFAVAARPARLRTDRVELASDLITFNSATGVVRTLGPATATFEPDELHLGDDCTVWIQGNEARIQEDRSEWWFRGDVRAWCGSHLLTADVIHGDAATLRAAGNVRLSLRMEGKPEVEVRAERMEGTRRVAVFHGDVVAEAGGDSMRCDQLRVELDGGELTLLECSGDRIEVAPADGGRVGGDASLFRFDVAAGLLEIEGCPAMVRRPDGNLLEAEFLAHDLETGYMTAR